MTLDWHAGYLAPAALVLLVLWGCAGKHKLRNRLGAEPPHSWVCVYSDSLAAGDLARFQVAVLDADIRVDLRKLRPRPRVVLGYVSLCETGDYRWFWPEVDSAWQVGRNPNWNSVLVDVRQPGWQDLVVERIIPRILAQGFDGLFLDTADTAEYLEKWHEPRCPGALPAVVRLVERIRARYPEVPIVLNRGYAVVRQLAPVLDGVVAESLFTRPDGGAMRLRAPAEFRDELALLEDVRRESGLVLFSLDYIDDGLVAQAPALIRQARERGFVPYLSTRELNRVFFLTVSH